MLHTQFQGHRTSGSGEDPQTFHHKWACARHFVGSHFVGTTFGRIRLLVNKKKKKKKN